ncbi:MAG: DUF2099 family protein [Candidatus Omnitrophica bacterium]|nr:DUF2099 family protein [Candidatus Omnitrophota bacterium]
MAVAFVEENASFLIEGRVSGIDMYIRELIEKTRRDIPSCGDLHLVRFFSSFVTVSAGKVIGVTKPYLRYCPLAGHLYTDLRRAGERNPDAVRELIKKAVESKIQKFGFFTPKRVFHGNSIAIPYGASEMMMFAMRKGIIDSAVIVCDGAGTVIVDRSEMVQAIGARMNGLFFTSRIDEVADRLLSEDCRIVFPDASIDQLQGVERAAELGYRKIAVTVNALMDEDLEKIKKIEKKHGAAVTVLSICTTGASPKEVDWIGEHSDIVWSCASERVRSVIGKKATLQISRKIPVYVLTRKGLDLIAGYCGRPDAIRQLDITKQYLIAAKNSGDQVQMGDSRAYLSGADLPVRDRKEPA